MQGVTTSPPGFRLADPATKLGRGAFSACRDRAEQHAPPWLPPPSHTPLFPAHPQCFTHPSFSKIEYLSFNSQRYLKNFLAHYFRLKHQDLAAGIVFLSLFVRKSLKSPYYISGGIMIDTVKVTEQNLKLLKDLKLQSNEGVMYVKFVLLTQPTLSADQSAQKIEEAPGILLTGDVNDLKASLTAWFDQAIENYKRINNGNNA